MRLSPQQKSCEQLHELSRVDRAAPQLKIDRHVVGDGSAGGERADIARGSVDRRHKLLDVAPVAQRLNAPGGGTGPERDEIPAVAANLLDALGILGRGDRALNQRDVIGPLHHLRPRLKEVVDVDPPGNLQELALRIEQLQLAAVAGGEFVDGEAKLGWHENSSTYSCGMARNRAI